MRPSPDLPALQQEVAAVSKAVKAEADLVVDSVVVWEVVWVAAPEVAAVRSISRTFVTSSHLL